MMPTPKNVAPARRAGVLSWEAKPDFYSGPVTNILLLLGVWTLVE